MENPTIGMPRGTDWRLPAEYVTRRDQIDADHKAGKMTEWERIERLTMLFHEFSDDRR